MGIRMVRQPSQTPNVTNIDDIIPFRYAYGDQDGYVIGKGNEISHTIDGSTFRINSGRIVLQGVETDIDANGVSFTIDNASETRYFVVYYEVNLATQTTSIKLSSYDTMGYPNIDLGDDLTANSSGIARLPLYRFTATSGVISNVTKVAKAIEYSGTALVGYDISKGTVEERLTNFGFNEGIFTAEHSGDDSLAFTSNSITKVGKYAIGNFTLHYTGLLGGVVTIKVSNEFKPKHTSRFMAEITKFTHNSETVSEVYYGSFNADGTITINADVTAISISVVNFGWEIE